MSKQTKTKPVRKSVVADLARHFSRLEPHELIRVRSHTEAWGALPPAGPYYRRGKG